MTTRRYPLQWTMTDFDICLLARNNKMTVSSTQRFVGFVMLVVSFFSMLILTGCEKKTPPATATVQEQTTEMPADIPVAEADASAPNTPTRGEPVENPSTQRPAVQTMFMADQKTDPLLTVEELKQIGIDVFESTHLRLLADQVEPRDREEFVQLTKLATPFFRWFQATYPSVLPVEDPLKPLQLTGSIMRDKRLFLQAGLLPEDLANLEHGKERGLSFWMIEPSTAYYRRHLALHEATHCLMNLAPHDWPVWYLEGMAELIACHRYEKTGVPVFAIMPGKEQVKEGFDRIRILHEELDGGRFLTISQILEFHFQNFYQRKSSYAWSWAFCYFLTHHPETASRFSGLMRQPDGQRFQWELKDMIRSASPHLQADWAVFIQSLTADYDFQRSCILWEIPAETDQKPPLKPDSTMRFQLQVNRHWQRSGIVVQAGKTYQLSAAGSYVLNTEPVPCICDPQGFSIEYHQGRPLGELQLVLYSPESTAATEDAGFLNVVTVGRSLKYMPMTDGELFFRINDSPADWSNNTGTVTIDVTR